MIIRDEIYEDGMNLFCFEVKTIKEFEDNRQCWMTDKEYINSIVWWKPWGRKFESFGL